MNPVKGSLNYPIVTGILTSMAVISGLYAFFTMPRMEDPSITIRKGLVLAWYPGATSEQVEKQVTRKLEEHIFRFPEVRKQKTYSTSRPGIVIITVELEEHVTDADAFWTKLRHEMNQTAATGLPAGVRGPVVNSDFGDTVAMLIAVHGKRYGYRELGDHVDRIQDQLRTLRNVGKLATYGEQGEQVWITSSLDRLSQYFADPLRVMQALQQRNIIQSSGDLEAESGKIPLRTTGAFTTEDQIRNVLVDVSRTGQPVYIRDFAHVERRYQDPVFTVRYDGEPAVLLSVEMQKGKNVVQLGEEIGGLFTRLREALPPDVQLDLIADQPAVVKTRMTTLTREFLIAIAAVILVTIILLPMRVAVIAAVAIPVTICTTLGVMNAIGVPLHQVSIAALIVVLGIVVDDAIVIADNYVDCLDRGMAREEAAWQCVREVIVPVLTATLTIISSFLPLLVLGGSVGEFIHALPLTVAVALGVSFVVAVLVTPLLCRFFIRRGLREQTPRTGGREQRVTMLDRLQASYNTAIVFFMRREALAVGFGLAAVFGGAWMFRMVPQQFFPSAERNQFVIDVWMPRAARIEATTEVMQRIGRVLAGQREVAHYASFTGQSAPRFYYNVNPQDPDIAYGQFIVNTISEKETPALVARLRTSLARTAPEALVIVKELQQGMTMDAPVEVRVFGEQIPQLQHIGECIEGILRGAPGAELVYNDYFEDSYLVDVNVNTEISNRLGLTNAVVSQTLAGGFNGVPVSTFWEGDRPVTVLLRLDTAHRASFDDVRNAYLTSPITHASVPLRSLADLTPGWQTSRIVRRNGIRTLTVRAFPHAGVWASTILNDVRPKIDSLPLPPGYRVEYGGEKTNSDETLPGMLRALGISILAIFLVLLIQFRNLSEPLIVMCSIPLTLFGAALGLLLTGNPFGFTAFTGLISLSGIVVRNAIILVDYINEKLRQGSSLNQAATEAGERRLRPIFLTTMAAAVGVTPMIVSRSSLWSPLAGVIAVGLVSSMFFTLIVVPVVFVLVKSRVRVRMSPAILILLLALLPAEMTQAAVRIITLPEAVTLALRQNSALKIARAKIREQHGKLMAARASYFPQLSTSGNLMGVSNKQLVTVPAGSLGVLPGIGPFPAGEVTFNQGSTTVELANTTLAQPLTQLFKIREGAHVAASDERISAAEATQAEGEVILAVQQLYYGLLAARKRREVVQAQIAAGEESLREAATGVRSGSMLEVAVIGARASLLNNKQSLLIAEDQIADLTADMDELMGLPVDTDLAVAEVDLSLRTPLSYEQYFAAAIGENPELRSARESVRKARSAVRAARDEYIPDLGVFARNTYQTGVPFLAHNFATFGIQVNWDIFDWGKRKGEIVTREAQLADAEENVKRITDRITADVAKAYRKLDRSRRMVEVAGEALALRRENERLSGEQLKAGVTSEAKNAEALAATQSAELDELQARLACRLAEAEIAHVAGMRDVSPN